MMNSMEIEKIKKVDLNEEVFQQLKKLLLNGFWKKNEKIPSEDELCKKFGVSRITVRHALQRLTSIGLIETRQGVGRFVCDPSVGSVIEQLAPSLFLDNHSLAQVNEFREMLDVWSAKLASIRADDDDILALNANYDAMILSAKEKNWHSFAILDLDFHVRIGKISKNSLISKTYEILYDTFHDSMLQIVDLMGAAALEYHRSLIDAISLHDVSAAETIARAHVENNKNYIFTNSSKTNNSIIGRKPDSGENQAN